MVKYPLTDPQKNLIRSLAPGLRDGTLDTYWIIAAAGVGDIGIPALSDNKSLQEVWKGVKRSDFDAFVRANLFQQKEKDKFTLNEYAILEAVDNDFREDVQPPTNHVTISGGDFRGAIVNAASTLNNVQQSIGTAASLSDDAKGQLTQLVGELQEALANAQLSEDDADEAEVLAKHVETAVEQVHREKPNKKLLSISVDGLEKAAKNIGRVAVPIATIGAQIATLLRPFMSQ